MKKDFNQFQILKIIKNFKWFKNYMWNKNYTSGTKITCGTKITKVEHNSKWIIKFV